MAILNRKQKVKIIDEFEDIGTFLPKDDSMLSSAIISSVYSDIIENLNLDVKEILSTTTSSNGFALAFCEFVLSNMFHKVVYLIQILGIKSAGKKQQTPLLDGLLFLSMHYPTIQMGIIRKFYQENTITHEIKASDDEEFDTDIYNMFLHKHLTSIVHTFPLDDEGMMDFDWHIDNMFCDMLRNISMNSEEYYGPEYLTSGIIDIYNALINVYHNFKNNKDFVEALGMYCRYYEQRMAENKILESDACSIDWQINDFYLWIESVSTDLNKSQEND